MTRLMAVPSVTDLLHLADFARQAEEMGAEAIHLDLSDGRFSPILHGALDLVAALTSATRLPVETHLLIEEPERHIPALAVSGARRAIIHVESTTRLQSAVRMVRLHNMLAGLALNPSTSIVAIEEALPSVDGVLLMTVDPGDTAAHCLPGMGRRVFRVRRLADKWRQGMDITVDGHIPPELATSFTEMGATSLVAVASDPSESGLVRLQALRRALDEASSDV